MDNTCNLCFANSGFYCVLWTMLGVQPFDPAFWGHHYHDLTLFFMLSTAAAKMEAETWFQNLLACWDPALPRPMGNQQDTCEFLHQLLCWSAPALFHMGWERRFIEHDECKRADSGSAFMPICFSFDPQSALVATCYLDDMIRSWHQDQGMLTGLLNAPQCLLLQIDRLFQTEDGTVHKGKCCIHLDSTCSFPKFRDHTLRLEHVDYAIVAAVAHLGDDEAGHCRAALKIQPTANRSGTPARWLLTEDRVKPTPAWDLPSWFHENIVLLGLVRSDCVDLHLYHDQNITPLVSSFAAAAGNLPELSDPVQAILNLCQRTAHTGPEMED
eukprot:s1590_g14.t1